MFAYIKGTLEEKSKDFVVVETAGIGYKIFMSAKSIDKLNNKEQVKIYTYYYVREDNISIYGFVTNEELKMFELLLSVSGIGAKSAITMLSNITPSEFALAVITNDTTKLTKIQGIGKKTAARMILELKDKLKTEEAIEIQDNVEAITISSNENSEEAIAALQILGYTKKQIIEALQKVEKKQLTVEEIIKACLKIL